VDVRVLGDLLRRDPRLAHLPCLREYLEVPRQAGGGAGVQAFGHTTPPRFAFVTAFSVLPAALSLLLCNPSPPRVRVHVIDETAPAVDLHDRDPLTVGGLELRIAVDRDFPQLEAELVMRGGDDAPGRRAEVATRRGVEDDVGYG